MSSKKSHLRNSLSACFSISDSTWALKESNFERDAIAYNEERKVKVEHLYSQIDPAKFLSKKWAEERLVQKVKNNSIRKSKFIKIDEILSSSKKVLEKATSVRNRCEKLNQEMAVEKIKLLGDVLSRNKCTPKELTSINYKWINAKLAKEFAATVKHFNPSTHLQSMHSETQNNADAKLRVDKTKRKVDQRLKNMLGGNFYQRKFELIKSKGLTDKVEEDRDERKKLHLRYGNVTKPFRANKNMLFLSKSDEMLG